MTSYFYSPESGFGGGLCLLTGFGAGPSCTMAVVEINAELADSVLHQQLASFQEKLANRKQLKLEEFVRRCEVKPPTSGQEFTPTHCIDELTTGCYYLVTVDNLGRRQYDLKK